jgi:hypothetical protein
MHQVSVMHDTIEKVSVLAPGFHRHIFMTAPRQYKQAWNDTVEKSGPKYAGLKQ